MTLSPAGLRLLKGFEGFRTHAYPDPASGGDPWTIGYGTTVYPDGRRVQRGDVVTEAQAEEYLRHDVKKFAEAVTREVLAPVSQSQADALISLAYNIGTQAFARSTLLRRLNGRDYQGAADEFLRWTMAAGKRMTGLERRRAAERRMFLLPDDPPMPADWREQVATANDPPLANPTNPVLTPESLPPGQISQNSVQPQAKPMAPVLAALLPSLVSAIPQLAKLFSSGSAVSERNAKAAETVAQIVVAATGAPNLQGAVETIQADPAARQKASEAVEARWYELVPADGGGINGARDFNTAQGQPPFWTMPAFWVSLALLPLLYGTVYIVLTGNGEFSGELKAAIASSVVTGVLGGVVGFWLGSSFTTSRSRGLGSTPAQ